jgi:hypothetical protein
VIAEGAPEVHEHHHPEEEAWTVIEGQRCLGRWRRAPPGVRRRSRRRVPGLRVTSLLLQVEAEVFAHVGLSPVSGSLAVRLIRISASPALSLLVDVGNSRDPKCEPPARHGRIATNTDRSIKGGSRVHHVDAQGTTRNRTDP